MGSKSVGAMINSPRPNLALLVACAVLAVICVFQYVDKLNQAPNSVSSADSGAVKRDKWSPGPGITSVPALDKNEQDIPKHKRKEDCKDTLNPGKDCYADSRYWAVQMGQILPKALSALTLTDEDGERVFCESLTGQDAGPAVVTVDQTSAYPSEYFSAVPAANFMQGGYPVRMRPGSTDSNVMGQFFCEPHFHFISSLGPWLPKNRPITVVDAGANIGLASILFSQFINFDGEVLSIEANPSTLEILEENISRLGEVSTVVGAALAPAALAEKGSTVNFVGHKDQYWGFRVLPDDELKPDMTVHKVPTKSLADIKKMSRNGRIDFMKIDIEGYEKEIFTDKASWPVLCEMRCIAAEVHDWFVPGCSAAVNKFLQGACQDDPFRHIANHGEYSVYCRMNVLGNDDW